MLRGSEAHARAPGWDGRGALRYPIRTNFDPRINEAAGSAEHSLPAIRIHGRKTDAILKGTARGADRKTLVFWWRTNEERWDETGERTNLEPVPNRAPDRPSVNDQNGKCKQQRLRRTY